LNRLIFTIVFNGRHHLEHNNYAELLANNCDQWVLIEGLAEPTGSTSWCKKVSEEYHDNGHSIDGTAEYIKQLADRYKNITLIQKTGPWKNKDEQVNAGITFLKEKASQGFLWQIDCDEQWSPELMAVAEKTLMDQGGKTGSFYAKHYVGKNLLAIGEWGEGKRVPYRRLWNWQGELFQTHEPPMLAGYNNPISFMPHIKFNHYAYFFEQDVRFKEAYYSGHEGIYQKWLDLQKETVFPQPINKLISGSWGTSFTSIFQTKPSTFTPEIKNDAFYFDIIKCVKKYQPKTIVEIGSADGLGSTQAFIEGIKAGGLQRTCSLHCVELITERFWDLIKNTTKAGIHIEYHCGSTVSVDGYMSDEKIKTLLSDSYKDKINTWQYPLDTVLNWRKEEIKKIGQITNLPRDIDMVLIDGSPFTGVEELKLFDSPKVVMLDDVMDIKNWENYEALKADNRYTLITENLKLRNGYAIFSLREFYGAGLSGS
jgi:glycosyltransferase involved in cell wall biosynthesis